MREAYRLNKNELIAFSENKNTKLHVAFQYIANEMVDFQLMNEKMQAALKKLVQNIETGNENAEKHNWIYLFNTNIYLQVHYFAFETAKL